MRQPTLLSSTTLPFLLLLAQHTTLTTAHGYVKAMTADGKSYQGYNPEFQWANPIPTVPGWSMPQNIQLGFVNDYSSPDMACHLQATPGKTYASVRAGSSITLEWTSWPDSHKGPVIDYLAACPGGDCTTITDKSLLLWNKIAEQGLIDGSTIPGRYAADVLLSQGNKWTVNIPAQLTPGNYVLRHEIIALHEGGRQGGAQNYPQCINIQVTAPASGSPGTKSLSGVGTVYNKLYTSSDPGILCDIYRKLSSYVIPGPALFNFGSTSSSSPSSTSSLSSTPSTSTPAVATSSTTKSTSTSTSSSPPVTVSPVSTFQTSTGTRATTTLVIPDSSTSNSPSTTGGSGGGSSPGSGQTGSPRRFICYEEL